MAPSPDLKPETAKALEDQRVAVEKLTASAARAQRAAESLRRTTSDPSFRAVRLSEPSIDAKGDGR